MTDTLWKMLKFLLGASPAAMFRGAVLSLVVLLMGVMLLGLSGWFITAAGVAGLTGAGALFNVFVPSAGVRLLALGRTFARYGERLLTHDATLRALAAMRVDLLRRQARLGARALSSLRSEGVLTRIISDVDALDGLVLRVALPAVTMAITFVLAFLAVGIISGWTVALALAVGYVPCSLLILAVLGRASRAPSDEGELLLQSLRRGAIDMLRDRQALVISGQLGGRQMGLRELDGRARSSAGTLDRMDRQAAFGLQLVVALAVALALVGGGWLWQQGATSAGAAAVGIFIALALAEGLHPLRRGMTELGRMAGAAERIVGGEEEVVADGSVTEPVQGATILTLDISELNETLILKKGEAAALVGPSGAGKTTLLTEIAGLSRGREGIEILGHAPAEWSDTSLRVVMAMVPQRSALIAGTIRENLSLAARASDDEMWEALRHVDLDRAVAEKGGLGARLGEGGAGLSGGQSRRLAIARAVLKRPRLLLLDEPTEGLDAETADRMLRGLRDALPETAILAALHRHEDHPIFVKHFEIVNRADVSPLSGDVSQWSRALPRRGAANND